MVSANRKQLRNVLRGIYTPVVSNNNFSSIIPVYSGSDIRYDDQIGFEEFSFIINGTTVQNTEGVLRRFFCRAPEMFILLSLQTLEPGQQMKITGHFIFASNSTEQGRAMNRCVEIVEQ
jgi:hypothetical protein